MVTHALPQPPPTHEPEPAWDIARLFPPQGYWDESEYLAISTNHMVELTDGVIEVLTMPSLTHQLIVRYLFELLRAFTKARDLGEVLFSPTFVRIRPGSIREPDVFFMSNERVARSTGGVAAGADLAMEVVSPDSKSRERDWIQKRADYAEAGIPEYWIVDPRERKIVVFKLAGNSYVIHAEAGETGRVGSALLPGFDVDAAAVWAAGRD